MSDPRFYHCAGPFSLADLIRRAGLELVAQPEGDVLSRQLRDVAPLHLAGPDELTFLDNPKYISALPETRAGACFVRPAQREGVPPHTAALVTEDPYRAYAAAAALFYPEEAGSLAAFQEGGPGNEAKGEENTSPAAQVHAAAKLGPGVRVAAGAVIGPEAEIGAYAHIGPHAVIGRGVQIGAYSRIGAHSVLAYALLGERVILHPHVSIGQDGFGFAPGKEGHRKVPQLGRVLVGDDVEVGAGSCIDRGSGPDTMIGDGTKIDNLVQIGHNVRIGRHCFIVAGCGIAGSTEIGDFAVLAGQVGIAGHLRIGHGVQLAAKSGVMRDIPDGEIWGGIPAVPVKQWKRQVATLARLIEGRKKTT